MQFCKRWRLTVVTLINAVGQVEVRLIQSPSRKGNGIYALLDNKSRINILDAIKFGLKQNATEPIIMN